MSEAKIPFLIRDPKGNDLPFVLNSWLKSDRDNGRNRLMSQETYYGGYRDECIKKLDKGFVTVACNTEDEDQIFGWVCADAGVIHYVYVKVPFRNSGVASALVKAAEPEWGKGPTVVSTAGKFHREWVEKYNLKYDPFSWQPTSMDSK